MIVWNRRSFLRAASAVSAGTMIPGMHLLAAQQSEPAKPVAANDHIQIALIGAGGQGMGDTKVGRAGAGRQARRRRRLL